MQCEPFHKYSTLRPYPGLIAMAFASKVYWLVSRSWHCMWLSSFRQLSIYASTLGIDFSLHQMWHSRFWIWHQSLEVRGFHTFVRRNTANVTCCACEHGRDSSCILLCQIPEPVSFVAAWFIRRKCCSGTRFKRHNSLLWPHFGLVRSKPMCRSSSGYHAWLVELPIASLNCRAGMKIYL